MIVAVAMKTKDYGMECDKKQWLKLLDRIEEVI